MHARCCAVHAVSCMVSVAMPRYSLSLSRPTGSVANMPCKTTRCAVVLSVAVAHCTATFAICNILHFLLLRAVPPSADPITVDMLKECMAVSKRRLQSGIPPSSYPVPAQMWRPSRRSRSAGCRALLCSAGAVCSYGCKNPSANALAVLCTLLLSPSDRHSGVMCKSCSTLHCRALRLLLY
jgi:hypothetical protein